MAHRLFSDEFKLRCFAILLALEWTSLKWTWARCVSCYFFFCICFSPFRSLLSLSTTPLIIFPSSNNGNSSQEHCLHLFHTFRNLQLFNLNRFNFIIHSMVLRKRTKDAVNFTLLLLLVLVGVATAAPLFGTEFYWKFQSFQTSQQIIGFYCKCVCMSSKIHIYIVYFNNLMTTATKYHINRLFFPVYYIRYSNWKSFVIGAFFAHFSVHLSFFFLLFLVLALSLAPLCLPAIIRFFIFYSIFGCLSQHIVWFAVGQ